MGIGATAIGRANYAETAHYYQAFFALSVGLERASKLVIVLDHIQNNDGQFPENREVREMEHNLARLLQHVDKVAKRLPDSRATRLPDSGIHGAIVGILRDFDNNLNRYYNLDVLTGGSGAGAPVDPVHTWHESITLPILTEHYSPRRRPKDAGKAAVIEAVLGESMLVRYSSESGVPITSAGQGALATAEIRFAAPFARMYVLQLCRFLAESISALTPLRNATDPISPS